MTDTPTPKRIRPSEEVMRERFTGKQGDCPTCGSKNQWLRWQIPFIGAPRGWCCKFCLRLRTIDYRYNIGASRYAELYKGQSGLCAACRTDGTQYDKNGGREFMLAPFPYEQPRCLLCTACRSAAGILKTYENAQALADAIKE